MAKTFFCICNKPQNSNTFPLIKYGNARQSSGLRRGMMLSEISTVGDEKPGKTNKSMAKSQESDMVPSPREEKARKKSFQHLVQVLFMPDLEQNC